MASRAIVKRALTVRLLRPPSRGPPFGGSPSDGPLTPSRLQPPHGHHNGRTHRRHGAGASARRSSGTRHRMRRSMHGGSGACYAVTWRFSFWERPLSKLSIIKGGPEEPPHANRFITENAPLGQA